MATKPTKRILDWASSGTKTDPGSAKEAAGWLTSDRPPAQWWNWVLSSFGDWLTYFSNQPQIVTQGWRVDEAFPGPAVLDCSSQVTTASYAAFSDGNNLFVRDGSSSIIYQYALTDPWNLDSGSYSGDSFNYSSTDTQALTGIFVDPTGTYLFILHGGTSDTIRRYSMTANDLSTASFDTGQTLSVSAYSTSPAQLEFSPDGTELYFFDSLAQTIERFTLSTGWDLTSATYIDAYDVSTQIPVSTDGISFRDDGLRVYISDAANPQTLYEYTLATAWDITPLTVTAVEYEVNDVAMSSGFIGAEGHVYYVCIGAEVQEHIISHAGARPGTA